MVEGGFSGGELEKGGAGGAERAEVERVSNREKLSSLN